MGERRTPGRIRPIEPLRPIFDGLTWFSGHRRCSGISLKHLPGQDPRVGTVKRGVPTFADTYHGKVVPLEAAKKLVAVDRDVTLLRFSGVPVALPGVTVRARGCLSDHAQKLVSPSLRHPG